MAFRARVSFALLPVLPLFDPARVSAQVDRTVIIGFVTDQQGNRVPQCSVHARETATGRQRDTLTTSQGGYEMPDLPPGSYAVRFGKRGFAIRATSGGAAPASTLFLKSVETIPGQTSRT